MTDRKYPFPSREDALLILQRDYCYKKIPEREVQSLIDMSWQLGVDAARKFLDKFPLSEPLKFDLILAGEGFTVKTKDMDYVSGNIRYFAEIQPGSKMVTVYKQSVQMWAKKNGCSYRQARNLILMHEYFHYLEMTELGLVSKRYQVYMIKIFGKKIGKTGIAALSEIAANGFARTIFPYALFEGEGELRKGTQADETTV